jgi:hypothetical protein
MRSFVGRCDPRPGLRCADGFLHLGQELFFRVVVLPAAALLQIDKMRAATLGQLAPLLRELARRAG